MKWGYYYNTTHYNGFGEQNIAGNVTFQDLNTGVPLNTNQSSAGGSAFASFLLGQVPATPSTRRDTSPPIFRSHEAYFQDDWRVNHRFTLNYGVRWSLSRPLLVGNYDASDFDPTLANPGAGGLPGALIFDGFGTGRINKNSLTSGWNGWAPRFGFAYSLNDKTTLRGAASRSLERGCPSAVGHTRKKPGGLDYRRLLWRKFRRFIRKQFLAVFPYHVGFRTSP